MSGGLPRKRSRTGAPQAGADFDFGQNSAMTRHTACSKVCEMKNASCLDTTLPPIRFRHPGPPLYQQLADQLRQAAQLRLEKAADFIVEGVVKH